LFTCALSSAHTQQNRTDMLLIFGMLDKKECAAAFWDAGQDKKDVLLHFGMLDKK